MTPLRMSSQKIFHVLSSNCASTFQTRRHASIYVLELMRGFFKHIPVLQSFPCLMCKLSRVKYTFHFEKSTDYYRTTFVVYYITTMKVYDSLVFGRLIFHKDLTYFVEQQSLLQLCQHHAPNPHSRQSPPPSLLWDSDWLFGH